MRIVESQIVNGRPQRIDDKKFYRDEFITEQRTCISKYSGSMDETALPTYTGPYPPLHCRKKARYSRFRFMEILGDDVMLQLIESTDPKIKLLLKKLDASKYVDMHEPAAIDAVDYLIAQGFVNVDRESLIYD